MLLGGQCSLTTGDYGYCDVYSGGCLDSDIAEVQAPVWLDAFHILFYFGGSGRLRGEGRSEGTGAGGLYVLDVTGEENRRLRRPSGIDKRFSDDYSPNLGPDGTTVVYATLRLKTDGKHNFEIISTSVDGKDFRRLTKTPHQETNPVVSPDGDHIAFLSTVGGGGNGRWDPRLFVMNSEGDDARALAPEVIAWGTPPAWSPDGRKLAFVAAEEGGMYRVQRALYVVDLDGGNLTRLGEAWSEVAWSPDGEFLAFADAAWHDSGDLNLVAPDGGEVRWLKEGCRTLLWSPDGREVVCGVVGLTATDVETGQTRLIRRSEQRILGLAWSPDGSRLAVRAAPLRGPTSWNFVLFTIAPDGTNFVPQVVQRDGNCWL